MLTIPISKSESTDITTYPLSIGQQALWSLCQDPATAAMYSGAVVMRVMSSVNVAALRQTFQAFVDRHDALRTTIEMDAAGGLSQTVHVQRTVNFMQIDTAVYNEAQLFAAVVAAHNEPFDLEKECSIRVRLFTQAAQRHLLLVTVPLIVSDGWSMVRLMMREIKTLYPAYCAGLTPNLPPLQATYADYVAWETEMLAKRGSKLGAWWQKELGCVQPLVLPTDYPRPPVQTFNGRENYFRISAERTAALKQLTQEAGSTLYMTLLGAFQLLLYRYTGQPEIIVGTPAAGRLKSGFMDIVGHFSNFLPMRSDLTPNLTFIEWLDEVKRASFKAQMHQAYPFSEIIRHADFERDPSYSPLMQVGFNFMNALSSEGLQEFMVAAPDTDYSACRVEWGGLLLEPYHMPQQPTIVDLTLDMEDGVGGTLVGALKYNADLFSEATIERMTQHFAVLLEAIVTAPNIPIQKLDFLTAQERWQIVHGWNDTAVNYGEPQTIQALFEQQVAKTPDAIALLFEEAQLTYAELNAQANQLAHHLIELGVQPDTLVALLMERSVEMMVALLSVLKAGGAYVPLDPTYPDERIVYMLADSGAKIVLTQSHLSVDGEAFRRVNVDTIKLETARDNPQTAVSPQNLAYCIYTSGSTGQPKGVLVSHTAISQHIQSVIDLYGIHSDDCSLLFASISFDVSVEQLFSALCGGAKLLLRHSDLWTIEQFDQQVRKHGVTICDLPLGYCQQVIAYWLDNPSMVATLPTRLMLVGNEKIDPKLVEQWQQLPDNAMRLVNVYGPTEAVVTSTRYELTSHNLASSTNLPIGQPLPNRRVFLLDKEQQIVPIGIAGELHMGGILARGYLDRPELTAERFIEHSEFGRLYKTGDLCRWLPDGNIEYIGRTDFQVKIRGFRIELGEIENALLSQEGVREAVVIAREDTEGDKQLVAYYVPADSSFILEPSSLQTLPDYMIPAAFVTLTEMPLTPSGKLDRRALPAPSGYGNATNAYIAPRSWLEQRVAEIWQRELQLEQVGIDDSFFEIGGHSLLLIKVQYHLRKIVGAGLPLADLLHYPTIRTFCHYVMSKGGGEDGLFATQSKTNVEIVSLREGMATETPLLCLPGRGGSVTSFLAFAAAAKNGLPVYGLQYRDLVIPEDVALPSQMSDFLTYFIAPLTAAQISRQHIIGHSAGGVLAFPLAIALQQAGRHVPVLAIMDTVPPIRVDGTRPSLTLTYQEWVIRTVLTARPLLNKEIGQALTTQFKQLPESELWEAIFDLFDKHSFMSGEDGVIYIKQRTRFFQAMYQCLATYTLEAKYAGQLILFRATQLTPPDPDPVVARWEAVCENPIIVHHLPCDHGEMEREPYINQVGLLLQQHIHI